MNVPNLIKYIEDTTARYPRELWVIDRILSFIKFLKSKPVLGDFIACDKNNIPLEEPSADMNIRAMKDRREWEKAVKRVRWVGFEIIEGSNMYQLRKPRGGSKFLLAYINKDESFEKMNQILAEHTYEQLIKTTPLEATPEWAEELKLTQVL